MGTNYFEGDHILFSAFPLELPPACPVLSWSSYFITFKELSSKSKLMLCSSIFAHILRLINQIAYRHLLSTLGDFSIFSLDNKTLIPDVFGSSHSAVRLFLAGILRQVKWWSVSMVTRYDVISSRWWTHFWVIQGASLCAILHINKKNYHLSRF